MLLNFINRSVIEEKARITTTQQLAEAFENFGAGTASGVRVTADIAIQQATVYACVRILSENIARLTLELKRPVNNGKERVLNHPAIRLFKKPNKWQTPFEFWQTIITHMELRGNAYGRKVKDGSGTVREILPYHPSAVRVEQKDDWSLEYVINVKGRDEEILSQDKMMHLRNMSLNSYTGLSTITLHKESVGLAIQTQTHGASVFKNGATLGKVFTHPNTLSADAYSRLKKGLTDGYEGAKNAGKSMLLEEGTDVKNIAMTSSDAQFLETRQFQVQEIASIFGVPLFLLQSTEKSTTWGSGIEQLSSAFVRFTLGPRIQRVEQMLARDILRPADVSKFEYEFDTSTLTKGDLKSRAEYFSVMKSSKILNTNEIREKEGYNNIGEEGDVFENPNTSTNDDDKGGTDET